MPNTQTSQPWADLGFTADGSPRAFATLEKTLHTLWFYTGSWCNIECQGCYVESSPRNKEMLHLREEHLVHFLDQIEQAPETLQVAFTGGEPFGNPHMCRMIRTALERGHRVLVLTNAMSPMQGKLAWGALETIIPQYRGSLTFRVSFDHPHVEQHDAIRGKGSFDSALKGLKMLTELGAQVDLAGQSVTNDPEEWLRQKYQTLADQAGLVGFDAQDSSRMVIFPRMEETSVPPVEITTACVANKIVDPQQYMCATQRMIVWHAGDESPVVHPCTIMFEREYAMGSRLGKPGEQVLLSDSRCSSFCMGGGSCT